MSRISLTLLVALTSLSAVACTPSTPAALQAPGESNSEVHTPNRGYYSAAPATPRPQLTPMPLPTDTPPATPTPTATSPASTTSPSPVADASATPTASPTATPVPTPAPPRSVRTLAGIAAAAPDAGASAAAPVAGFADGTGSSVRFSGPSGVALAPTGVAYVADALNNRLRLVTLDAQGKATVTTVAGTGTLGLVDGVGRQAQFGAPRGVAVDPRDPAYPIYVADTANHAIRKVVIDQVGNVVVSTVAGTGKPGLLDGSGTKAQFSIPYGVTVDPVAQPTTLYVADTGNNAIRKVVLAADGSATVSTLAGNGTAAYIDGASAAVRFSAPHALAADGQGHLYVADTNNHCVRLVSADGTTRTLAGNGTSGVSEGTPLAAVLNAPWGIAVDAGAVGGTQIFVVDGGNHRVCRIAADGTVMAIAGSGPAGDADGVGALASFLSPAGLALDVRDRTHLRLWVNDLGNQQLRAIE